MRLQNTSVHDTTAVGLKMSAICFVLIVVCKGTLEIILEEVPKEIIYWFTLVLFFVVFILCYFFLSMFNIVCYFGALNLFWFAVIFLNSLTSRKTFGIHTTSLVG